VLPQEGKVGFGSGLHAWGFTLRDFAKMYSSKFGLSEEKLMKKFWGENYWDAAQSKWVKKNTTGSMLRGFEQFILKPMRVIFDSIMAEQKEIYEPVISALRLKFAKKDLEKAMNRQKDYLKLVMRTWIPAGNALLDMIVEHLPSPSVAQEYRTELLYTGPLDSEEALAVQKCDQKGPMSMYVSKMVPTSEKGRFYAFGRVFSGTIKTGQEIRILGPDFVVGKKKGSLRQKGAAHPADDGPLRRADQRLPRGQRLRFSRGRSVFAEIGHSHFVGHDAPVPHHEVQRGGRCVGGGGAEERGGSPEARRGPQAIGEVGPFGEVLDLEERAAYHQRCRRASP